MRCISQRHTARISLHRSSHRLLAAPSQLSHTRLPWQLSLLSDAAANIAAALLADWFRMDLFLGHPQLELCVNEITYPSHILDDAPQAPPRRLSILTDSSLPLVSARPRRRFARRRTS